MSEAFKSSHGEVQILKAEISEILLTVHLSDERIISIPLKKIPRLDAAFKSANAEYARNFKISKSGYGIHWPDLDEDISIKAFL